MNINIDIRSIRMAKAGKLAVIHTWIMWYLP